jgi:hypothetical protein
MLLNLKEYIILSIFTIQYECNNCVLLEDDHLVLNKLMALHLTPFEHYVGKLVSMKLFIIIIIIIITIIIIILFSGSS